MVSLRLIDLKSRTVLKFITQPHVRLLLTGTLFMVAFVWMAISAYDVDKAEIKVFAVFSVMLLGVMVVAGLIFSFVLILIRRSSRREGLLGKIESIEKEVAAEAQINARSPDNKAET